METLLPLLVAATLIGGAVGKLRRPADSTEWAQLGLPSWLRRDWMVRLHPWGELALGIGVAVLGGAPGRVAALLAGVLFLVYTVLIWAAWRRGGASCGCFGAPEPVTGAHVARNLWLLILAVGAVVVIGATPVAGGASLRTFDAWRVVLAALAAALTLALVAAPKRLAPALRSTPPAPVDEQEYVRTRTPNVPVTLADGTHTTLPSLTSERPVLLVAVTEGCTSCRDVVGKLPELRQLLPEVDVRLLLSRPPEASSLAEQEEPQSVHDPHHYVRGSIADWPVPTALLLGADGMLAGGPVSGRVMIERFVEDIYFELNGTEARALHSGVSSDRQDSSLST